MRGGRPPSLFAKRAARRWSRLLREFFAYALTAPATAAIIEAHFSRYTRQKGPSRLNLGDDRVAHTAVIIEQLKQMERCNGTGSRSTGLSIGGASRDDFLGFLSALTKPYSFATTLSRLKE